MADLTLETLDRMTPEQERAFLQAFDAQVAREDGSEAVAVLAAGQPIYYCEDDTPSGCLIKQYPDGRRELVDVSTGEDRAVRPPAS